MARAEQDRNPVPAGRGLHKGWDRHLLKRAAFFGPAFVAAIGYIDPGNYATNIEAGDQYGNMLLWVIVWANLIAVLVQLLSSKLGPARGLSLVEVLRAHLPPWATRAYWVQAEILAIATDLAEFVGAALGFLVLSQVVLSFGISLALIPLVIFTSRASIMGDLVNRPVVRCLAWLAVAAIVTLNLVPLAAI